MTERKDGNYFEEILENVESLSTNSDLSKEAIITVLVGHLERVIK